MTAIFHTNAGAPVLAGDMLLSIRGPKGFTNLRLPSQPNGVTIPCNPTPSYIPVQMRRKIFIINDRLAVGAAGLVSGIAHFIDALAGEFCNKSRFTYTELCHFMDQYSAATTAMAHIDALVLAEATDWRGSLVTNRPAIHRGIVSGRFGKVIAIGTGTDSILEQVQRLDTQYNYGFSEPTDGATRFPEFRTLANNLMLLANVYWREFASPDNIFDAWGGAYDLIYQDSHKAFKYLSEYTIFLRIFDVDQSEKGIQLANVLKYERRPDVSFITMLNNGKLDFCGAKDITAPDTPVKVSVGHDFTMDSKVHISIIAIGKGDRFASPIIQIDGLDRAEQAKQTVFTRFDEKGRLCVAFHAEHDQWLEQQATAYYQRHADSWS